VSALPRGWNSKVSKLAITVESLEIYLPILIIQLLSRTDDAIHSWDAKFKAGLGTDKVATLCILDFRNSLISNL
jgi:hypothetical protein